MNAVDVIIVGAGMAGLSLACMLAERSSLSILVLESKSEFPVWLQEKYASRVSAINLASRCILKNLTVWNAISARRVSRFERIQVWDENEDSEILFDSKEIGEMELGYIIENNAILNAFTDKLKNLSQVQCLFSVNIAEIKTNKDFIEVVTSENNTYRAKLLVVADGAHSRMRKVLGIGIKKKDYQQEAIVATVKTALPHGRTARQVFLSTGPLAFLPLEDEHFCSIVWSLSQNEAEKIIVLQDKEFVSVLGEHFPFLGEILESSARQSFHLQMHTVDHYVKARVALIGDAAHSVHPLAGLGINMGFLDAASLADILLTARDAKKDIGAYEVLRKYERFRKADNFPLIIGIDLIQSLFQSRSKIIKRVRNLGLNWVNQVNFIKSFLCRYAVGKRSNLPTWVKY